MPAHSSARQRTLRPQDPTQDWNPESIHNTNPQMPAVFTNRVEDIRLQDLAEVDSHERVVQVQEFFGDFAVLDPHHFAVQLPKPAAALQPLSSSYNDRCPSFRNIFGVCFHPSTPNPQPSTPKPACRRPAAPVLQLQRQVPDL